MKRRFIARATLVLLACLCPLLVGARPNDNTQQYIIGVENMAVTMAYFQKHGIQVQREIPSINAVVVKANYHALENMPFIRYIELDLPDAVWVVDDILEYGVDNINAEVVWGGNEDATDVMPGQGGMGIKVAVLDTGIACDHEDLAGDCFYGADLVDDGHDTSYDDYGHGTHVAGIIGARDNGIGYIGVAPEVELYAVKVLDSGGGGYWSSVIAGIDWAIQNDIDIINMSLGTTNDSIAAREAIRAAYEAGILVVSAAGNGSWYNHDAPVLYPAAYPESMAISAVDSMDNWAGFSCVGPEIDVAAPGVRINSAVPTGTCWLCDPSGYASLSGTSMAAPYVVGAGALLMSRGYTNVEARQLLAQYSKDLGKMGYDEYYGYGRVDALGAIIQQIPEPYACDCGYEESKQFASPNQPFTTEIRVGGDTCRYVRADIEWKGEDVFRLFLDGVIQDIYACGKGNICHKRIMAFYVSDGEIHNVLVEYIGKKPHGQSFNLRLTVGTDKYNGDLPNRVCWSD